SKNRDDLLRLKDKRPRVIKIYHDPQSYKSQMRMNRRDLGQMIGNKARITASRNDGNIFTRKLLRFDSSENLANQSAVAEDGAGTHRVYSRFTDGMTRLFQRQQRQQRCPAVQKVGHRFESLRNPAADVA